MKTEETLKLLALVVVIQEWKEFRTVKHQG
jgi:hypothetical protein